MAEYVIDANNPRDVLEAIESRARLGQFPTRWRIFMEDSCSVLVPHFSSEASRWFGLAVEYRAGRVSAAELTSAGKVAGQQLMQGLEGVGARAVVGLLVPDDLARSDDAWFASLDVFIDCCNSIENRSGEQARRMRELFADVLAGWNEAAPQ
jgi:hypothetical protein